jgi:O-antigen ligase
MLEMTIDRSPASPLSARICTAAIFLLPAIALTTKVSVGLIEVMLLLSGIGYATALWRQRVAEPFLLKQARPLLLAFLFNLIVATISLLCTGFQPPFFENPSKMLLATLATGMVLLLRPSGRALWPGLWVGAIGAMLFAIYQRFGLMLPRAEGFSMPITFGDLAMAMGLMSLAGIRLFARTRWATLPYLAFVAGVVASILSASRGGWLALLLSFIPLYVYGRDGVGRRALAIVAASLIVLGAVSLMPETGVRERLTEITTEVAQYQGGNPNTSVGARIEMWKGAWTLFIEHPLTGVGRANFNTGLNRLIQRGAIDPAMGIYRHAHNEMLNALATEGMPGGLALLALYGAPLVFFGRRLRPAESQHPYALAGVMMVLAFIAFGMTQVMFVHHVGSAFYALMVCTLAGLCLQEQRRMHCAPVGSARSSSVV